MVTTAPAELERLLRESQPEVIRDFLQRESNLKVVREEVARQAEIRDWFHAGIEKAREDKETLAEFYQLTRDLYRRAERGLPVEQIATFINEFRRQGDHQRVITVYDETIRRPLSTGKDVDELAKASEVLREHTLVALNKTMQFQRTIDLAALGVSLGHKNGEIYGAMGSAYRKLWETDEADTELLRNSLDAYRAGYLCDFEFYPGINVVYNLQYLGETERADQIARLVDVSCRLAGGLQSKDYWCLATQVELACILRKDKPEVQEILRRVENHANTPEYAGWTLPTIKRLRKMRAEAGENVEIIDTVIAKLKDFSEGRREVQETEPTIRDRLMEVFFTYEGQAEGPSSHFVGGNIRYKGQLHAHMVSRSDLKGITDVLKSVELLGEEDFKTFNQKIDAYLRGKFGTKELDDIASEAHRVYDQTQLGSNKLFQVDKIDEGVTNLTMDLMLGLGDCRQHAYLKQLFFDVWKRHNITSHMREAYNALQENNDAKFGQAIESIHELLDVQMYVADVKIKAPFKMKKKYRPCKKEGLPVLAGQESVVEDHTLNVLVQGDSICLADVFYQNAYHFGYHDQACTSVESFLNTKTLLGGRINVYDPKSKGTTTAEVTLTPTGYAGARQEAFVGNHGGLLLRGFPMKLDESLLRPDNKKADIIQAMLRQYS